MCDPFHGWYFERALPPAVLFRCPQSLHDHAHSVPRPQLPLLPSLLSLLPLGATLGAILCRCLHSLHGHAHSVPGPYFPSYLPYDPYYFWGRHCGQYSPRQLGMEADRRAASRHPAPTQQRTPSVPPWPWSPPLQAGRQATAAALQRAAPPGSWPARGHVAPLVSHGRHSHGGRFPARQSHMRQRADRAEAQGCDSLHRETHAQLPCGDGPRLVAGAAGRAEMQ